MSLRTVVLLFAGLALALDQVSEDLPLFTTTIPPLSAPTNIPPIPPALSSNGPPTNCYIEGPCDCQQEDPDYPVCVANPKCQECWINDGTLTPLASTQIESIAPTSSSSTLSSTTTSNDPPDKCWIGGPCDCSKFQQYSDEWYACITDPSCTQCYIGDRTLTPPPPTSTSSSGLTTTTNFKTMLPGTYRVTDSGTIVIIIVTDEPPTRLPLTTEGRHMETITTWVVQTPA